MLAQHREGAAGAHAQSDHGGRDQDESGAGQQDRDHHRCPVAEPAGDHGAAERRAEVSSTYFVVAYVAISLPVVGAGLAAQQWGLRTAGITFAIAVAALSAICLAAILFQEARARTRAAAAN